ncbi:protein RRP5 homolog [Microplitis demolitor]|uniref:protein RRP5 homolog n=1 Tax=Microplitis demolitor TaxID=69319 RepID=UPI00044003E1|nr:protein RRP5 homolog [Microplitis demolitor]
MTLEDFPRGGKKTFAKAPSNFLLGNKRKLSSKKKSHGKKTKNDVQKKDDQDFGPSTAECLTYSTIVEGMIILGRIYTSTEYDITVSLPGRLSGQVLATYISDTYTNLLEKVIETTDNELTEYKPLNELFKRGDYVVCYVKGVNPDDKNSVKLSLESGLINQNLDPGSLAKGSKIVCSVSSVEDHGYVVDTGIKTLRGFLAHEDVAENAKYHVGQQIFCAVKKVKTDENVITVNLSTKSKRLMSTVSSSSQQLDSIIPGSRLDVTIKKILRNGLRVSFNENNTGYINRLYLNEPLESYHPDSEITVTLLYIIPTLKFAYFSELTFEKEKDSIKVGDIVDKAAVLYRETKGIVLNLKDGVKGFVSFKRTEVDFENIKSKFIPGSTHKCRILSYDIFDRIYVCTMQKNLLKAKSCIADTVTPGDVLTVEIMRFNPNGFIFVKSGNTFGDVPPEHVADSGLDAKKKQQQLKVGAKITARVLGRNKQDNGWIFTLKKSLVESKHRILSNIDDATVGSKYQATIFAIKKEGLVVSFFGDVKGFIPAKFLNKNTGGILNYRNGQVLLVKIEKINEGGKLILNLAEKKDKQKEEIKLNIGEEVAGIVVESSSEGVYLRITKSDDSDSITGFLPAGHMAPCKELGGYLAAKCVPGDSLTALVFSTSPKFLLTRTYIPQEKLTKMDNLKVDDCIPCSISDISSKGLKVVLPIEGFNDYGVVPFNKVTDIESLSVHQILFGKITFINKKENKIHLTVSLHEVWTDAVKQDVDMVAAVDVLTLYLSKLKELSTHQYYSNKALSTMHLGQRVKGVVDKVTEHGLVLKLENDVAATVRSCHFKKPYKVGNQVEATVLWINYIHELVEVTLLPTLVSSINSKQNKLPEDSLEVQLRGEIVLITNFFALVVLKGQGKGTLVSLPTRRHANDMKPDLSSYVVGKKVRCYVILNRDEAELTPVGVVKSAFESRRLSIEQNKNLKRKKPAYIHGGDDLLIKRLKVSTKTNRNIVEVKEDVEIKSEDEDDDQVDVAKENDNDNGKNKKDKKKKHKQDKTEMQDKESKKKVDKENLMIDSLSIPECGFNWDNKLDEIKVEESSSSSEDEDDNEPKKKKKKLSAAERHELERQKEREIRQREEALASNQMPNSVDQFDRLVLASPDSSLIWLQYMAYHLQATEVEKARAVAKRALKTINFREESERLNVWQGWLNLESRFGTPETLNDVFQQALKANDTKKIYLHMITVHADAARNSELEHTIKTVTGKFKQDPDVWTECGCAFLKLGLKEKSRFLMQRALQSLPPKEHVNLMVKFAQMENRFGDKERAETLFEKILISYPKRVDVWSSYVDVLVKSENFDAARKVLEKGVMQSLPPRKMKILFKKYVSFEEQFGTPAGVEHATKLAQDYVNKQTSG